MKKAAKYVKQARSISRWTRLGMVGAVLVAVAATVGLAWFVAHRRSMSPNPASEEVSSSGRTKDELYEEARAQGIRGRSKMSKEELEEAIGH
jgi:hypothetical protein